jgi:hypothetical protein
MKQTPNQRLTWIRERRGYTTPTEAAHGAHSCMNTTTRQDDAGYAYRIEILLTGSYSKRIDMPVSC